MTVVSDPSHHRIRCSGYRNRVRVAIAVFDGAEELDFAGPWEVLSYWAREVAGAGVEVICVGPTAEPIRAAKGLRVLPEQSWHDCGQLDLFVLPGGRGTRSFLSTGHELHAVLHAGAAAGTLMTSVCTGSLVFAAAGLLRDLAATTHWRYLDQLAELDPSIDVRPAQRYVDAGDVVTAAGVSAGIDMALHLVARLDSIDAAKAVRRGIQYDPEPPV
jgi:transcriptional regulator GlxA family with amidase domain